MEKHAIRAFFPTFLCPIRCSSKPLEGKALVKRSARFSVETVFLTITSHPLTSSLSRWYFLFMHFPLLWLHGSLEFDILPLLSQHCVMVCLTLGTMFRSIRNLWRHTTSLAISQATTYSTSMVESKIHDFLILFYIMAFLPRINMKLEVDFMESLSD